MAALFRFCIVALALAGCAPVMEANRPDPVDLGQFAPGEKRLDIVKTLGAPATMVNDGPKLCGIYQLYTHGPERLGKAAIALGEGAADVVTLGLSEVIFTPVEAGTRNGLHTVAFCYGAAQTLVSIEEPQSRVSSVSGGGAAVSVLTSPAPSTVDTPPAPITAPASDPNAPPTPYHKTFVRTPQTC